MRFFRSIKRFPLLPVVVAAALIAALILFFERVDLPVDREGPREAAKTGRQEKRQSAKAPAPRRADFTAATRAIAVIIDDIGFDLGTAEELSRIRMPIAFAVLPNTPHAAEAARLLHAAGKEVLLHLPMEPLGYPAENPGAGALFVGMDEEHIRRQMEVDLGEVPYASGVNNHMGSRFMADEAKLSVVMDELSKRGLFFVDSRTTADTMGRTAAAAAGVRFAERAVFIDHEPGYAAALSTLLHLAEANGGKREPLLVIGHPHPATIRALRAAQPLWRERGVRIIPVSACIGPAEGRAGDPGGE